MTAISKEKWTAPVILTVPQITTATAIAFLSSTLMWNSTTGSLERVEVLLEEFRFVLTQKGSGHLALPHSGPVLQGTKATRTGCGFGPILRRNIDRAAVLSSQTSPLVTSVFYASAALVLLPGACVADIKGLES